MNGRVQVETVSSLVLKDNPLGDPRRREIPVYLPPSYGKVRGKRYPVLYYLPGFTGGGRSVVNYNPWKENAVELLDRLISTAKAAECLLVVADCFTAYGGSQYLNSSATGRYEDHVADELVPFIEDKFAVIASPRGRAVLGKSSGGFGALTLAMRRPGLFGHVACHSGDMGFDACYWPDLLKLCAAVQKHGGSPERFVREFRGARDKAGFDHSAVNAVAMAACYSPNPRSPLGFDLPVDVRTGERVEAVWRRWEAFDPVRACGRRVGALRTLRTLLIDAGRKDEFFLQLGARRLARELKRLRVRHVHEEHEGGHFDLSPRLERSLSLLSRAAGK
jgi:enterochelin esterase family protein